MTLYLIGLGLGDEKDITIKGLEKIKGCELIYLENYTSKFQCSVKEMEKLYEKKIVLAERNDVECDNNIILKNAKQKEVALLVIGDPMGATTHVDLLLRCKKEGIKVKVFHNASIINAVGIVGLELYKYSKTTSIPFPEKSFQPETAYDVIKMNRKNGLHTLCLLDLRPNEGKSGRFMSVKEAIDILLKIEEKRKEKVFTKETLCIGCARIGSDNVIKAGKVSELIKYNFGEPPHCLIIPGKLHFIEEEALKLWR